MGRALTAQTNAAQRIAKNLTSTAAATQSVERAYGFWSAQFQAAHAEWMRWLSSLGRGGPSTKS